eukprot:366561-Chlamydomonas_euryale.AAC.18
MMLCARHIRMVHAGCVPLHSHSTTPVATELWPWPTGPRWLDLGTGVAEGPVGPRPLGWPTIWACTRLVQVYRTHVHGSGIGYCLPIW